jgi:hypothetical protein
MGDQTLDAVAQAAFGTTLNDIAVPARLARKVTFVSGGEKVTLPRKSVGV